MPNITVEHSRLSTASTGAPRPRAAPGGRRDRRREDRGVQTRTLRTEDEVVGAETDPDAHAIVHVTLACWPAAPRRPRRSSPRPPSSCCASTSSPPKGTRSTSPPKCASSTRRTGSTCSNRYEAAGGEASAINRTARSVNGPSPGVALSAQAQQRASSSSCVALTAASAAKSCTSCTSSSPRGIRRPSSQISAVDSTSEIQSGSPAPGGRAGPRPSDATGLDVGGLPHRVDERVGLRGAEPRHRVDAETGAVVVHEVEEAAHDPAAAASPAGPRAAPRSSRDRPRRAATPPGTGLIMPGK